VPTVENAYNPAGRSGNSSAKITMRIYYFLMNVPPKMATLYKEMRVKDLKGTY